MTRNRARELFNAIGPAITRHPELLKDEVRGEVRWLDVKWARMHVKRIEAEPRWGYRKIRERSRG